MSWLQLRLDTAPAAAAALEERLLAAGAVSVTLEDNADEPVLEPGVGETPLWQQTRLTGLFPADADMDSVLAGLDPVLTVDATPRVEILEDKDWSREWMQHYRPLQFGPRFWVCPSWLEPPDPTAVNLLLDPGLAFGTGTHPTTALCLAALADAVPAGARAVDYGCGSGILAVAAAKLGAGPVLCVDNDPQALAAAADNAARNGVALAGLTIALPGDYDASLWQGQCDLVVANILAGPLLALAPTIAGFLRPGGVLLLSGLLASQAEELIAGYAALLPLAVAGEQEGWVVLRGEKPR
ncbi:50S ribosomal protein L11 methyltransferase [Pseudohaliea rubra]|uniref:Ribosomal protein L11 methyltransferase n=1 Tax=Pseudohaliea rubra DSM 19751 TaxID=1265313 RepID=A0A095WW14_9GAMM|nr:50S ribosomal protein L11 methyltransferase [Pseudohaliea rubra]KGE02844.1 Ribosomal protein L11 methyltransferase [Pseudohaliea rubra DSM 19751]